ncbi:MAG: hypothetical protein B0D92_04020 [Spirochaeta sp. LUC14_002_19_P3]|nr:MAG: hypothetical protein B0D92_04020 [Spirochaeta sp. LUC14_002_19_P3]
MNGDLFRAWKKSKKNRGRESYQSMAADVREVMARLIPAPRAMAKEIADYFITVPFDEDVLYRAEEIVNLFTAEWSREDSLLNDGDWDFIKEMINAWALEMDMDIVTNVMRATVESGNL